MLCAFFSGCTFGNSIASGIAKQLLVFRISWTNATQKHIHNQISYPNGVIVKCWLFITCLHLHHHRFYTSQVISCWNYCTSLTSFSSFVFQILAHKQCLLRSISCWSRVQYTFRVETHFDGNNFAILSVEQNFQNFTKSYWVPPKRMLVSDWLTL